MIQQPDRFHSLHLEGWRQFGAVDLIFHPRLTVLTGANASGKTTILNILGRHFNMWGQLLGIPRRDRSGQTHWVSDSRPHDAGIRTIGELVYEQAGQRYASTLSIPSEAQSYDLSVAGQRDVPGVYITSHRSLSTYQPLANIPIQFSATRALLDQYIGELRNRWYGGTSNRTPLSYMKEALIAAAIHGSGNRSIEPNVEAEAVWIGFQRVLSSVLPRELEFEGLRVRLPDLLVGTRTSEFLIEAMSGGVSAIIELAWQIFLRSREFASFTVCIDEPENHLHPSLQRAVIPGFLDAFPSISFIVATHSPFIVTSVPESNVYALEYADTGVVSRLLDTANKAATTDETLRRVLGLETTSPLWVERRLEEILSGFEAAEATPENLRELRDALIQMGLRNEFPAAVDALTRTNDAPAN